jgi:NADP-dependent 3-hydroxy acid dehydrogenase YdfG
MPAVVGHVDSIARAVEYVVTQPIDLNIEEIIVRPQKSMF